MKKQKTRTAGGFLIEYRAQRPSNVAGKILREYQDKGVRMYQVEGSKNPFLADAYDKMFKTERTALLPKKYKGKNPDGTHVK